MSQEMPPPIKTNVPTQEKKSFLSNLSESAGAATKIVAKQAERTKISTITLPTAYLALGKDCVQQNRHLDSVAELVPQLRSVCAEIKKLSEIATQSAPQSFSDKAKAAGKYAVDAARQKQLGMKRDSLITSIGRTIYEKHSNKSGPLEFVGPVESALARISEIEAEIGQQSNVGKGTSITPKRMLVGGAAAFVLISLYFVFARTSSEDVWSTKLAEEKAAAIAKYEPQFLQMLKAGDSAWDAGQKDDAVQNYSQLLALFCGHGQQDRTRVAELHMPEMARAAGRTIDFLADSGNDETAKDLIRKADQSNLVMVYKSPKVNRLIIKAKADQDKEDRETDEWLEREEKKQNNQNSPNSFNSPGSIPMDMEQQYEGLVNRVKIGMSKQQVEAVLGIPDECDEKDIGKINPAKAGLILEVCTWRGDSESQSSIVLGFVNGKLQDGGTPGYDVRKGFSTTLPPNMNPTEKAKMNEAATKLGLRIKE